MLPLNTYDSGVKPNWCPGCGDFGILAALKKAMAELELAKDKTLIVTGIGCSSELTFWVDTYGFQSIHGRILPVATAVHLCNHELNVICFGGDGDGYGIGLNHAIHAMRRNLNLTYITADNQIYGLTKGQTSPTSCKGTVSPSTPFGVIDEPIYPMRLALASGATYIAQGFAGDIIQLTELIKNGIQHKGFSLIDVYQPCPSMNKHNSNDYYKERCYKIEEEEGYDRTDKMKAMSKAMEPLDEKFPTGLFYKEEKAAFHEQVKQIESEPLYKQNIEHDVSELFETFI